MSLEQWDSYSRRSIVNLYEPIKQRQRGTSTPSPFRKGSHPLTNVKILKYWNLLKVLLFPWAT